MGVREGGSSLDELDYGTGGDGAFRVSNGDASEAFVVLE